jgi:hypothetical protein
MRQRLDTDEFAQAWLDFGRASTEGSEYVERAER